jgi:hypothetical protein
MRLVGRWRPLAGSRKVAGGICLAGLVRALPAGAQTVSPEDTAAARALGTEGVRLADAGDCAGAIAKLTAAEKIFHAPTTLERLGECEIQVGKIVAGTEHLQRVIREPLPPNAPPAFTAAKQHAQDALGPALPRIGRLKVHVDGVPPDKVTMTVDGAAMPSALLDAPRPTDPGTHTIQASAPGYKTASSTVTIGDGGESAVTLKLDPAPNAVAAPPSAAAGSTGGSSPAEVAAPPPAPAPGGVPAPAASGSTPVLGIASLVAGGVGVGVGALFGVLAMGAKSTLDGECGPTKKACPNQSDINTLDTDAVVADVGFGVGVAGLAVGAILIATHRGSETAAASEPHVTPWVGIGSAGLRGTFQ